MGIYVETILFWHFSHVLAGILSDLGLNWVTVLTNVSAEATSAIVGDLRPSTAYQFRVSAVNNVGEGSPSDPSNSVILPQEGKFFFNYHVYNKFIFF